MKPLVVAIERDREQAARLDAIVRMRAGADLVLAASTSEALAALGDRVPDLILAPPLLPARDEAAVADRLRQLGSLAAHVQTITVPRLGSERPAATRKEGGLFKRLRRAEASAEHAPGCDPEVFAQQVLEYLQRAQAERTAAAEAVASAGRAAQHRTAEIAVPAAGIATSGAVLADPVDDPYAVLPADMLRADSGVSAHTVSAHAVSPHTVSADTVSAETVSADTIALYAEVPPAYVEALPTPPAAYDPILELLVPNGTTEMPEAPLSFAAPPPAAPLAGTIEEVLGFEPMLLVDEATDVLETPLARLAATTHLLFEESEDAAPAVIEATDAAEPLFATAAISCEAEPAEPIGPPPPVVEIRAAEPLVAVAAIAHEPEPVAPAFPVVVREIQAAEPLAAVTAVAYEQEPIVPTFPHEEPAALVEAAEPIQAVAWIAYEQEPIVPAFPYEEPAAPVEAAEPIHAVAGIAYEQEPAAPLFPVPDPPMADVAAADAAPVAMDAAPVAMEAAAFPAVEAMLPDRIDVLEDGLTGIGAFAQEPAANATAPLPVAAASLLDEPDEDIASAIAAAAAVTDVFLHSNAVVEAVQPAVETPIATVASPAPAGSDVPLPAIDFSDLELEFLMDEEPRQAAAEPVAPPADIEAETPFVIATTDFDDLEISEFLEALVTAQPEPEKKKPARSAGAAPKPQAATPKAQAAPKKAKTATKKRAPRTSVTPAASQPPAPPRSAPAPRPAAPIQDEWGVFDPDQCGFAALVAKLDEITEDEAPPKRPGSSTRVISYS